MLIKLEQERRMFVLDLLYDKIILLEQIRENNCMREWRGQNV